jgi:hypothetical protein
MGDPVQRTLQEAIGPGPVYVELATIDSVESHTAYGYLLNCTTRPGGLKIQARPLFGVRGVAARWSTNDAVLLLIPAGDPNRALAIGGLTSLAQSISSTAANDHLDILDAGGVQVRKTNGAVIEAVLRAATFQTDLNGFLTALQVFMTAVKAAVIEPSLMPASTVFQATPAVVTFCTRAAAGYYSATALKTE